MVGESLEECRDDRRLAMKYEGRRHADDRVHRRCVDPSLPGVAGKRPRSPAHGTNSHTHTGTAIGNNWRWEILLVAVLLLLIFLLVVVAILVPTGRTWFVTPSTRILPHIIPPLHVQQASSIPLQSTHVTNVTLRDFLLDSRGFHLAMAPAFFGFYGYFGVLDAWRDVLGPSVLTSAVIRSVAGASAGAMAAVLLAAGIPPRQAARYCDGLTISQIGDFPGLGAVFRGRRVERLMRDFLVSQRPTLSRPALGYSWNSSGPLLEDAEIPVAVSAFDLATMRGVLLTKGSMARAARASATFPLLFQPIAWTHDETDYMLIDGGIADTAGTAGLSAHWNTSVTRRVVNLQVGSFWGAPPGPASLPVAVDSPTDMGGDHRHQPPPTVVSISIQNLPHCGPWALSNGPIAVEAAYQAMRASLDVPLYRGTEPNHYELHLDTSYFWKKAN